MDTAASSLTSTIVTITPDVAKWTIEQVVKWAKHAVNLDEEAAQKLHNQKVDGASLIDMATIDNEKLIEQLYCCGIPGGPAVKLATAIRAIRPIGEPATPKRLIKTSETVSGFSPENLDTSHFIAERRESVAELIDRLDNFSNVFVIQSSPFTGKTSLLSLVANKLMESGKTVVSFSLLDYFPSQVKIGQYFVQKCNFSWVELCQTKKPIYVLIDEFQKVYPNTVEDVQKSYPGVPNAGAVAASHFEFIYILKQAKGNRNFRGLFASGYESATMSTPVDITTDEKTMKFAKFTNEEMKDLFADFLTHTKITFIKNIKVPESFIEQIKIMTDGHVGYTSAIIHYVNDHYNSINNENHLLLMLKSEHLYNYLQSLRPTSSQLTPSEQEALKTLLLEDLNVYHIQMDHKEIYESLLKRGWVVYKDDEITLPCPLSNQLFLMSLHHYIQPETDVFHILADLMNGFIAQLSKTHLQSVAKSSGVVSAAIWQKEFYQFVVQHVEKSTCVISEFPVGRSRVDFWIYGNNRKWAIEFLIWNKNQSTHQASAQEHVRRFNGQYSPLEPNEWLVLDFRPALDVPHTDLNQTTLLSNYWVVVYNFNKSVIEVTKFDEHKVHQNISKPELFKFVN